ncbi:MAG: hypothetical protein QM756_31865 [Polyangiaceae bacterium]
MPNLTGGVRLGYAFRGGPAYGRTVEYTDDDQVKSVTNEGNPFLPFHAEVRGAWWFGAKPMERRGFRPYVHLGGGMAQVDAKIVVRTHEEASARNPPSTNTKLTGDFTADAWKKMGQGFVTVGGGAAYAFTTNAALQLNLNIMYMLGSSGIVLQPSLGMTFGLF